MPAQLCIDSHDRSHQRSHHQRSQTRSCGCSFQVAHVRLQGRALYWCGTRTCRLAQRPRCGAHLNDTRTVREKYKETITHLDRVSERRARAVRLQRRSTSSLYRFDEPLLRRPVRRREARARPVLLHRRPGHRDVVGFGREVERPAAFAPAVPVGASVERMAPPEHREHARR